ncbi:hypothetical protein KCU77_g6339, partial [Aureobasidium melanogenum]
MELFPIVCAAPLSEEVLNRFIEHNDYDMDNWNFVFVDSLDECYTEPSFAPVKGPGNPNSPFIGKTPRECSRMLVKLCDDTGSDIIPLHFIIMDERSIQDDTVLLVTAEYQDNPLSSVRATFEASASALDLYLTGHSDPEEHAWYAEATDNVYCGPEISRRN